jgi:hypothetical protein
MIRVLIFLCLPVICFANSISLFNDSQYTLKAVIYDATGTLLGEFILNPRDAVEWSDDDENFGTEIQNASQTPYSVDWSCMRGDPFGTCTDVSAGAVVTAQGCSGAQQCGSQQKNGY